MVCVEEWEMLGGDVGGFPSGLAGMRSKLGVPFLYYMPYWCQGASQWANSSWSFLTPDECGWDCLYSFVAARESAAFHEASLLVRTMWRTYGLLPPLAAKK